MLIVKMGLIFFLGITFGAVLIHWLTGGFRVR